MGRKVRVVAVLLAGMLAILLVLNWLPSSGEAPMPFVWNLLAGAALGVLLAVLPLLAGVPAPRIGGRGQWWVGMALLLVLLFQFLMYTGALRASLLEILQPKDVRVLVGEGALVGYVLATALRAKK